MGVANCCLSKALTEANNETEFNYNDTIRPLNYEKELEEDCVQMQSEIPEQISTQKEIMLNDFENGLVDNIPIQVKAQKNIRSTYWNEYPGDILDLQYDISEDKSLEIFEYLNAIKMNPIDYLEEAKSYGLENLIEFAIKSTSTQTLYISNEGYYYMIRELLATQSDPQDLSLGIKNYFEEKQFEVKVLLSKSNISNAKEAVWNLLLENKNNPKQILIKESEYLIVCSLPIPDTNEMNNYFVFLKS